MHEALVRYQDQMTAGASPQYLAIAAQYCERHALTREDVAQYIADLRRRGYADGTVDKHWRVIRRLFKVNGVEWPFRRGESPTIREQDVHALALPKDTIQRLILSARNLSPSRAAYLALSTTYGLRRTELQRTLPDRWDLSRGLLYVETAKHGRQRYHKIPEAILPVLERAVPHMERESEYRLSQAFHAIERLAGVEHAEDTGWHAIRRSLNHYLIEAGATPFAVEHFLRWKRSANNMVARYHAVTFVGADGGISQGDNDRKLDEEIFQVHPFLPIWRDA
jgi:site-specific recombinase XerD